jgi:Arc/MetJ-type ribon-helix-helix transcriptional regulator
MSLTLDPATEARIQRQLDRGAYTAPEDVINHALDLLEQSDDDLTAHRAQIVSTLEQSIAQADRGEGFTEEQLRDRMAARRASHQQDKVA